MEIYKIIRFYLKGNKKRTIQTGLSLEQAQEHCKDKTTHKINKNGNVVWFDGYRRM
jgi:hypothetical protein